MYGMAQSIPDRSMVSELAGCFVEALYSTNKDEYTTAKSNGAVHANGTV